MKLVPIKNEIQYETALSRIYDLMQTDIKKESAESDELEVLSLLVKEYELITYPIPKPKPLEAIKYKMEQMNITESQLAIILGSRSRKSEILSGKRN